MMKKILLIMMLVLILQGCSWFRRETPLEVPSNVRQVEEKIVWDKVEDARVYQVQINGQTRQVSTNEYSIFNLPNGSYEINIRAVSSEKSSEWTTFSLTIARTIDHPKNLSIDGHTLSFEAPSSYASFNVSINGNVTSTTETTFDLSNLSLNELYEIKVQTVIATNTSEYSETIYYAPFETKGSLTASYNQALLRNVSINLDSDQEVTHVLFNHHLIDFRQRELTIFMDFNPLLNLEIDNNHTVHLLTETGIIEVDIHIEYEEIPYLISINLATYTGEDLIFDFDLFGGSFTSLSASVELSDSDYQFESNQLIIRADFFDQLIAREPERTRIVFAYSLTSKDNNTYIGYLFIDLK